MSTLTDGFQTAVTLMHKAVLDLPNQLDRWVMNRHQPQPMDENTPWCFTCRRAWPCDEFAQADERIRGRQEQ